MPIPCAVLMCHAPIVLPEVAGSRAAAVAATTRGMRTAAECVVASQPDVVALVSPHTPRARASWGVVDGAALSGDFGSFRTPEVGLELPMDGKAVAAVRGAAQRRGLPMHPLRPQPLDHGALVPLHFLVEAGWRGPVVLLAFPWEHRDRCAEVGEAVRDAADALGQRWAFVASGDMSHRLIPGAPAGFHPRASDFDAAITRAVRDGDYFAAVHVDAELRELAAEDVVDSIAVAAGAVDWRSDGHRFLSYEGPFGVGYLVAVLHEPEAR